MGFLDAPCATVDCPGCNETYCTKCKRVSHGKKTCQQVKAEEDILKNPVHLAHEKMSQATIRRCPSCLTSYSKLDGCNKIRCKAPGCNTLSCYLCEVQIQDYSHFCNHTRTSKNPCPCGKPCELWTSTDKMHRRDREARRKAGRKVLEDAGMAPDKIEQVLASPPAKKAPPRVAPVQPVSPQAPPMVVPDQQVAAPVQLVPPQAPPMVVPAQQIAAPVQPGPQPQPEALEANDNEAADQEGHAQCIIL